MSVNSSFTSAQIDYLERAISDIIDKTFDKYFDFIFSQHLTSQTANITQIKPTKQRKRRRNKRSKHMIAIKSAKNIRVNLAILAKPLRNCRDKNAPKLVLSLLSVLEVSFSQAISLLLIETAMRAVSTLEGTFELLFRHGVN